MPTVYCSISLTLHKMCLLSPNQITIPLREEATFPTFYDCVPIKHWDISDFVLLVQSSLEEQAVRLFSKCGLNHTLLRVQERRACEKWKPMGPAPQDF